MAESIAFWVLALILIGSALAVVLSKNLFHAVLRVSSCCSMQKSSRQCSCCCTQAA